MKRQREHGVGRLCTHLLWAPAPNPDHLLASTSENPVPWPCATSRHSGKHNMAGQPRVGAPWLCHKNETMDIGDRKYGQASWIFQFPEYTELLLHSGLTCSLSCLECSCPLASPSLHVASAWWSLLQRGLPWPPQVKGVPPITLFLTLRPLLQVIVIFCGFLSFPSELQAAWGQALCLSCSPVCSLPNLSLTHIGRGRGARGS